MDTENDSLIDHPTSSVLDGSEYLWGEDEEKVNSNVARRLAIRRKIEEWREDRNIELDLIDEHDWDRPRRRRSRKHQKDVH